ncbi:uncharacterized protein LOC109730267 [Microcebus murinus]|uniref:uncharacterized protein LOC109730267 n=1 Tax=Microcebus murinus TaxID=30608 RepID=UPI003F6C2A13
MPHHHDDQRNQCGSLEKGLQAQRVAQGLVGAQAPGAQEEEVATSSTVIPSILEEAGAAETPSPPGSPEGDSSSPTSLASSPEYDSDEGSGSEAEEGPSTYKDPEDSASSPEHHSDEGSSIEEEEGPSTPEDPSDPASSPEHHSDEGSSSEAEEGPSTYKDPEDSASSPEHHSDEGSSIEEEEGPSTPEDPSDPASSPEHHSDEESGSEEEEGPSTPEDPSDPASSPEHHSDEESGSEEEEGPSTPEDPSDPASSPEHHSDEGSSSEEEEGQSTPEDPSDPASVLQEALEERMSDLVHFLLLKYRFKDPITKAEMLNIVLNDYQDHFPEIFMKASECMQMVFGVDVKEVDPAGHSYVLVTTLGLTYYEELNDDQRFPKSGLLIIMLGLILFEGDCAPEEVIWEALGGMGVHAGSEHYIYGEPRKLITQDWVQEGYLEYRQVPDSDPACYEFLWGPRAHAETSKMKVLEYVLKVNRSDHRSFPLLYEESVRDEEEGA